jgi:hypothetical protein
VCTLRDGTAFAGLPTNAGSSSIDGHVRLGIEDVQLARVHAQAESVAGRHLDGVRLAHQAAKLSGKSGYSARVVRHYVPSESFHATPTLAWPPAHEVVESRVRHCFDVRANDGVRL